MKATCSKFKMLQWNLQHANVAQEAGEPVMQTPPQSLVQAPVDPTLVGEDMADRKSTRLNSSHSGESRMPSSA